MVYVVQEVEGKNITSARKFGELRFLLPAGKQLEDIENAVDILQDKLDLFDDNDYLLLIGDPVAIGIVASVAANKNFGSYKVLKWDKQEHQYFAISVQI